MLVYRYIVCIVSDEEVISESEIAIKPSLLPKTREDETTIACGSTLNFIVYKVIHTKPWYN